MWNYGIDFYFINVLRKFIKHIKRDETYPDTKRDNKIIGVLLKFIDLYIVHFKLLE